MVKKYIYKKLLREYSKQGLILGVPFFLFSFLIGEVLLFLDPEKVIGEFLVDISYFALFIIIISLIGYIISLFLKK